MPRFPQKKKVLPDNWEDCFSAFMTAWTEIPREWKISAALTLIMSLYLILQVWAALRGH